LEGEVCNTLKNICDRKWLCRVIEFKADHFLGVCVNGAICEAPEETHNPGHVVELVNNDIPNG